jgi:DNA-binding response OmpR family regulator
VPGGLRKVLVADDDQSMRVLVRATVQSDAYEVLDAADGDEAWRLIQEHEPDLVLLDVGMPGMSGLELARAMRADPRFRATKIMMLTARVGEADVEAGLLAGADHYLKKPFSPFELLALVDEAIGRRG